MFLLLAKIQHNEEKRIYPFFSKRLSRESANNSCLSFLPTQQSRAQSNNPLLSSTSSQDEDKERETTSTFKTSTSINEGKLTFIDVLNLIQDPEKRRRMSQFYPILINIFGCHHLKMRITLIDRFYITLPLAWD